jgi:hypothetical protein
LTTTSNCPGNHPPGRSTIRRAPTIEARRGSLSQPPAAEHVVELRRVRLEALLQITARDFELRLEFGNRDLLGDGQIVMHAVPAQVVLADYRALKGRALHLLGHYLSDARAWADAARREEAAGRPYFAALWHVLEDARIENWLARRWPGMSKAFDARLPPKLGRSLLTLMSPTRQLEFGLYLYGRFGSGRYAEAQFSPKVQAVLDTVSETLQHGAHGDTPRDSFAAARIIYPEVADLLRGSRSRKGRAESLESDGVNGEAATERRAKGHAEAVDGPDPLEAQGPGSKRRNDGAHSPEIETTQAAADVGIVGVAGRQREFPEWFRPGTAPWFQRDLGDKQVHPTAMRTDRQTIVEPPRGDHAAYRELWAEVQQEVGYLVQRLTGLMQDDLRLRYGGQYRTGKLNTAKLWKQRMGHYRLFQRRISGDRSVAFTLLVDESASMAGQNKCYMAKKAAILLGETINRLDVPLEIIGYTTAEYEARAAMRLGLTPAYEYATTRCSPLEHRIYKRFDEPFLLVRTRLTGIEPRHNNWDEEHLMFAFRRLQARTAVTNVLLVISDGQPNGDANALIAQVDEIRRLGCKVIAVGAGQAPTHDFVRQVYPRAVTASNLRQLAEELLWILTGELQSSRASRAIA